MTADGARRAGRKDRVDRVLVDRGLAKSRERAQALVMAGRVRIDGRPAAKPGQLIAPDAVLDVIVPDHPFVGRGGVKLAGALDRFGLEVAGTVALDIGASTGGFTDCLLRRGAARVYALDVGTSQLDWSLRRDPRVVVLEGINARYLRPDALPEPVGLVTVDVSFKNYTPAEMLAYLPGFERTDAHSIRFRAKDMVEAEAIRTFITTYRIDMTP